jgi:hypothetical protein
LLLCAKHLFIEASNNACLELTPTGSVMVEKTSAFRRRRAEDVRRCRARQARGAACYYIECDAATFDLLVRFEGLDPNKTNDRQVVAHALGRLLRRALGALLREVVR